MRVSIVAVGSLEVSLEGVFVVGEKAEERSCAILAADQVAFMPSWNLESSITRTSDAERRPSIDAEAASSFLRVSPRPSAFPALQLSQKIDRITVEWRWMQLRIRTTA